MTDFRLSTFVDSYSIVVREISDSNSCYWGVLPPATNKTPNDIPNAACHRGLDPPSHLLVVVSNCYSHHENGAHVVVVQQGR